MRSLEERVDEIESRTRIAELVARYCEGVDRGDPDVFASIWHDDASYLIGAGRGDFQGIEDIKRFSEMVLKIWKSTYHWTTNHVITFEAADRAGGTSEVFAMCEQHDGEVCFVAARYVDVYERRDDTWRIARRDVQRWFVSAPQSIDLLAPR